MLTYKAIHKDYDQHKVLSDLNLTIQEGEFVSIIGPSGCGKSTLIGMAAGLVDPTQGQVLFNDRLIKGPHTDRMLIFQQSALFPWLTVYENVAFGLKQKKISKEETQARVMAILKAVYLSKYKDKYPHQLSGGMKQRVAIARSLILNPNLLLMDEPFSALDEQTRNLLHKDLQALWLGNRKTVVFVTHSIREAVKLSTRIILLGVKPGRIIHDIPIDLPYPRSAEDPQVFETERHLHTLLVAELEKVVKEEFGDDYGLETNGFLYNPTHHLGSGI